MNCRNCGNKMERKFGRDSFPICYDCWKSLFSFFGSTADAILWLNAHDFFPDILKKSLDKPSNP